MWIAIDFPAEPVSEVPLEYALREALGVVPQLVARNRMDVLALVDDRAQLVALEPSMSALARLGARGFIVTCAGDETVDFYSRFFAPRIGVPEDPVTGSAHCALVPFWSDRLARDTVTGFQTSTRGGVVRGRVVGDRVVLMGQAV